MSSVKLKIGDKVYGPKGCAVIEDIIKDGQCFILYDDQNKGHDIDENVSLRSPVMDEINEE